MRLKNIYLLHLAYKQIAATRLNPYISLTERRRRELFVEIMHQIMSFELRRSGLLKLNPFKQIECMCLPYLRIFH